MKLRNYLLSGLVLSGTLLSSCGDDDVPDAENDEEFIDLVTLTFTPTGGGTPVVATATDPDGEGVLDYVLTEIDLNVNTTYTLSIELENTIEEEDVTAEVAGEGDEHMIFFSFTTDIFSDPAGNGNVDNRSDDVNYNDEDVNMEPIGLSTTWTTSDVTSTGDDFQVILKHQPNIKTSTSGATDGVSDIDITWTININ